MLTPIRLTRILQAILFLLFIAWLFLFIATPVKMFPDSYGYINDSEKIFDPAFRTMRPILFPFFLRIINTLHLKASVVTYLLNCTGLLYLVRMLSGGKALFSLRNTVVMIAFFLLTGIWSYCGTFLTESILFSVEIWIFIFFLKILFPERKQSPLITIAWSLGICLLATLLKPWIMIMIVLCGALLCLASLFFKTFRSKRLPSFILLVVSVVSFVIGFAYNRSKSQEKANMVVLMISSGNEDALRERLANDKGLSEDNTAFMKAVLTDIQLINTKYNNNPWIASNTTDLKVLNIADKRYAASIDKAFRVMYFQRFKDFMGLVFLAFERYVSQLRLDASCFGIAYGPELPVLNSITGIIILVFIAGLVIFQYIRHDPPGKPFYLFIGSFLLAGTVFSLLLCLAGADELQRTVLPAPLFQLFALAALVLKNGASVSKVDK